MAAGNLERTSGLAIAALVLGILGFCTAGVTAVVGLVLGIVALILIGRSQGRLGGSGLAIAGICVAVASFLVLPAMLLPALHQAKRKALRGQFCMSNMKQLAFSFRTYAMEHTNQLPSALTWSDDVSNYVASAKGFHCPADSGTGCSYAFNRKLAGKNLGDVNPATVLLFESSAGWNASGGPEMMETNRHGPTICVVVRVDGTALVMRHAQSANLRWDP